MKRIPDSENQRSLFDLTESAPVAYDARPPVRACKLCRGNEGAPLTAQSSFTLCETCLFDLEFEPRHCPHCTRPIQVVGWRKFEAEQAARDLASSIRRTMIDSGSQVEDLKSVTLPEGGEYEIARAAIR